MLNREMWDERAPAHAASPDYHLAEFLADPTYLSEVVRFDQPRLGDIAGLDAIHLQCHIGTDTVSLARLGARMTGLDFSRPALEEAQRLADAAGADIAFVHGTVEDALQLRERESFDLVYTGIGALCWLASIDRWAAVVAGLLRPGGRLFIREGHPVLWSLADARGDGLLVIEYPYVELAEGTRFDVDGTYVATDVTFAARHTIEFNHGLGEIVTALLDHGMTLTGLVEHDSVPWDALPGLMDPIAGGEFRLRDRPERLPHSYTLTAVKR